MDLLQNGVRTLKRHSISNISDAIRNHIHRDSFSGLGRHLFSLNKTGEKTAIFTSISTAVVHIFQKKKLQENELSTLQESVRNLIKTEAGPLIYDYYKDKLIKEGMLILRETIKHETGLSLLDNMGEQWNYVYGETLPILYALLYPVEKKSSTIRHEALLEFRNTVLLKLPIKDALGSLSHEEPVFAVMKQMLLVLQGVHESPYTDNYIELEKLVAMVISPHLGILGLYEGGSEPEVKSNYKQLSRPQIPVIKISEDTNNADDIRTLPIDKFFSPQANLLHHKHSHGHLPHHLLTEDMEQDKVQIRRYSIATT